MQRELKFRVWSKTLDRFLSKGEFCLDFDGGLIFVKSIGQSFQFTELHAVPPENYVVQQFTGLRDTNGVEIYEGDILKVIGWRGSNGLVEVKWERVDASDDAGSNMVGFPCFDEYGEPEIVGNIFENPELLC